MTQVILEPGDGVGALPPGFLIDADIEDLFGNPPTELLDYYAWVTLLHPDYSAQPGTVAANDKGQRHDYRPCCWNQLLHPVVDNGFRYDNGMVTLPEYGGEGGTPGHDPVPNGFRLGLSQLATPAIGDWLPASPSVGGSPLPLLPPGAAGLSTGWQRSRRPVLDGTVDLITGLPLLQVTDLELPFGGATFRLTRTRSAIHPLDGVAQPSTMMHEWTTPYTSQVTAADHWWDWVGSGWMAGENPILLIDSAVPDLVGPHPRTTWLVLDAHHAIPFQQVNLANTGPELRVGYEAPPRFRARMKHNGTWGLVDAPDPDDGQIYGWQRPPTQYDVWLYDGQVNMATIQSPGGPTDPLVIGFFVKHYVYDGLGRLIRTQSPYPDPVIGASTGQVRSERFYYDGIRRIQEVLLDPVADTAAMAGDPAALAALAANPDLDGSVATMGTEESQSSSTGGGGGPPPGSVLNREYVWGPGDRGVDELLVQYDISRLPTWPLQDAGLDAIALCDLGGGVVSGFPNGTGRVIWQGTYDAYGSVLTADPLRAR